MKFEILDIGISPETIVMRDITEIIDGVETVVGQEETDEYEVVVTVGIKPNSIYIPNFSKGIVVRSHNSMRGFEVDDQREQAVADYMQSINAVI